MRKGILALACLMALSCAGFYASQGDSAAARGDWDRAVEQYERSIQSDPTDVTVSRKLELAREQASDMHLGRANDRIAKLDYERAIEELRQSLAYVRRAEVEQLLAETRDKKRLADARAERERGVALEASGDLTAARAAYERALSLDPSLTNLTQNVGRLSRRIEQAAQRAEGAQRAFSAGDLDLAEKEVARALELHAMDGAARGISEEIRSEREGRRLDEQARRLGAQGEILEAVDIARQAERARSTPERARARAAFEKEAAQELVRQGDGARSRAEWDQAIALYERAQTYDGGTSEIAIRIDDATYERAMALGRSAEAAGDVRAALERYRSAQSIRSGVDVAAKIRELEAQQGEFKAEYSPPALYAASPYWQLHATLQSSRMLENTASLLNTALLLPEDVTLATQECGVANAFYDPARNRISMCLELIAALAGQFGGQPDGQRLFGGSLVFVLFHELGHALVDVYSLPITGREEDAVDQFSTLMLLGSESDADAGGAIGAAVWFARTGSMGALGDRAFADTHSLDRQRFFNIVCWVYGKDPVKNVALVSQGVLPGTRAASCPREYAQMKASWDSLLTPHQKGVGLR
jgi:tetratricopeptide (TPR) repeat protein